MFKYLFPKTLVKQKLNNSQPSLFQLILLGLHGANFYINSNFNKTQTIKDEAPMCLSYR